MQVHADRLCARELHGRAREIADLLRTGITDRVGDADRIDAGVEAFFDQPQHLVRIDCARNRAAQRHRDRGVHDRLVCARIAQLAEPPDVGDRGFP